MKLHWRHQRPGEFDHEAVWGALALAALAAARFLPLDRVTFSICWFHALSGMPCPSCGSTRAFAALAHGRWAEGLAYNPAAAALFFIMLLYVPYAAWAVMGKKNRLRATLSSPRERRLALVGCAGFVLVNWSYLVWVGR